MIELSRHIEKLLLQHDCVIIPDLGGFITQYVPARRIANEQIFIPPHRSVGFNQQLTLNDGLLVQSYMQTYDTNYPETIKIINEAVRELKEVLLEKGEYDLPGIGHLTLGIGGQYNFTPCESGVVSPDLYGLDTVPLKEISTSEIPDENHQVTAKKKVQILHSERNYTISISREFVNYAASIAAAIFFYFLWATPLNPSQSSDLQASSMLHRQLFTNEASVLPQTAVPVQQTSTPAQPAQPLPADILPETPTTTAESVPAAPTSAVEQTQTKDLYTIVLISAVAETNAEEYAQKLKSQGFTEAYAYKRGQMVRVVYGKYQTEPEAQKALNELRQNEQFADAWVLRK